MAYPKQPPANPFSTRPAGASPAAAQRRALNLLLLTFGIAVFIVSAVVYGIITLDTSLSGGENSSDLEQQEHPRSNHGGLRSRFKHAFAELRHAVDMGDPYTAASAIEQQVWSRSNNNEASNEEVVAEDEGASGSTSNEQEEDGRSPVDEPNKRIGEAKERVKEEQHQKLLAMNHEFGHEKTKESPSHLVTPQVVIMPTTKPKDNVVEEPATSAAATATTTHNVVHVVQERANKLGDMGDEELHLLVKGEPKEHSTGDAATIVLKDKQRPPRLRSRTIVQTSGEAAAKPEDAIAHVS